jgi:DNA-binding transcriptional regulator YbjK
MPVRELSDKNLDGTRIGQSTADLVAHYGVTPVSQRAAAAQATTLLSSSVTFSTAHLAALQEVMNTLAAVGLWKGSA